MQLDDVHSDPLRFASLIAHQLQSPLSTMSTGLQTVLGEYTGPLTLRQRQALERANAQCDQAIASVRRMLAIVKAEAGAGGPAAATPLGAVLNRILAEYANEAAHRDLSIEAHGVAEGLYVAISEPALTEVFMALLGNAMKYTPDHGAVRVTVRRAEQDDCIDVLVADSGIGIAPEMRNRVFEPFVRGGAAQQSARPGVGLGLTFVKSVVAAAGGRAWAERADLGGAQFVLSLPRAPAPSEREGPTDKAASLRALIIGGVAAGSKAAAKIIRLQPDADVTIIERGNVMSYAGCGLPYYVSGVVRDQRHLISSPAGVLRDSVFFRSEKNVHVLNRAEAVEIDRVHKRVRVRDERAGAETWTPYDKLLLATGASALVPDNLPAGLRNVFTLHGVRDAEGIRATLSTDMPRDVVIVGGGLLGIEMTEALVQRGARVTVVEQQPSILPILDADMALLVERHLQAHGVRVLTGTVARSFRGKESIRAVVTDRGVHRCDMAILGLGVTPNAHLAETAGLDIGPTGAIAVDDHMRTSDPDIYAAGDCAETTHLLTGQRCHIPMGSTAQKQARVAAVNMCGGDDVFQGVLGSCICRVFEYSVARTGLGQRAARDRGHDVEVALAPGPDRAHYMPTAKVLLLKLIVDRGTRRLLGAQATGPGVADKRIDAAAMAIAAGMTVDQLANADLCYAPPYGPAMDNLITAANVARNKLDGHMVGIACEEVRRMQNADSDFVFLDVRTPEEHAALKLPGSTLIPLGALRERMPELPRDKAVVVFSSISLRGYEASLVLRAAGFADVRVMDGGIAMWPYERMGT